MEDEKNRPAATLITAHAAANLLGVKRQTLYLWVREGRIPYYRLGKRLIKFDREELLRCFKVEPAADVSDMSRREVITKAGEDPFRLMKEESPEKRKQRERYEAMLVVE